MTDAPLVGVTIKSDAKRDALMGVVAAMAIWIRIKAPATPKAIMDSLLGRAHALDFAATKLI